MNHLYPFVEKVLKEYSNQALITLIGKVAESESIQGELFGAPSDYEYVFKRLLGGCLSKDTDIKFNAFTAIQSLANITISNYNVDNLSKYILSETDHKKHCGGKKSEIDSYVIGKILILKAYHLILQNNKAILQSLIQHVSDFPEFQEQIVQILFLIAKDKNTKSIATKAKLTTKSGQALQIILSSQIKKSKILISQSQIDELIQQCIKQYPRASITLAELGHHLSSIFQLPSQFFTDRIDPFFKDDNEKNIRQLYYLLFILQHHLASQIISHSNYHPIISISMIKLVLEQLRVKNKQMKDLAHKIQFNFQKNAQFSMQVLKQLHENKVYLENISSKHPLSSLYQQVDAKEYWKYIYEQATKEEQDMEDEDRSDNLLQLEFIVRHRYDSLTSLEVGATLTLLIAKYHQNKTEKYLNLIWSLINHVYLSKKNKKLNINSKASLILSKIDINLIKIEKDQSKSLKNISKDIRLKIQSIKGEKQEKVKQQNDKTKHAFYNFQLATIFFSLIYPEQIEICEELILVQKDLSQLIFQDEVRDTLKKKRKKSNDQVDEKKPIHVLIDIFISLLTKAPQFLRTAIQTLFQQLIPQLQTSDLSQMLEVIQKPDQEYIEEI